MTTFAVNVESGVITHVPFADALKFKSPSDRISQVLFPLTAGEIKNAMPPPDGPLIATVVVKFVVFFLEVPLKETFLLVTLCCCNDFKDIL